jgi:hypothetical protein
VSGPGPQIGGQIDDLRASLESAPHPGHRCSVRQRAEDERAALEMRVVVGDEADLVPTQARAFSLSLVGTGEMKLERLMARDEGAQLAAGVAGRAEHPNGKFMHGE